MTDYSSDIYHGRYSFKRVTSIILFVADSVDSTLSIVIASSEQDVIHINKDIEYKYTFFMVKL